MQIVFIKKFMRVLIVSSILIGILVFVIHLYQGGKTIATRETVLVARGNVIERLTMTGKVEAKNIAKLSFPTTGVIQNVYKDEGDTVIEGEILATLIQNAALNEYSATIESIRYYQSSKEELLNGPTDSLRTVTATDVAIAEQDLARTIEEHNRLVETARDTLYSNDITAYPKNSTNNDTPPTITGNYQCETEGEYVLSVYPSGSPTNYSYSFTGLEQGLSTAYTDSAHALGTCGLYIQFDADEQYRSEDWVIPIPNTRSLTYQAKQNAYKIALQNQANAISLAEQAFTRAQQAEQTVIEAPRKESLAKINANIAEARALASAKEARIADYTIRAPFKGTITNNSIRIGETASPLSTITVLQDDVYDFKMLIPEVDITKVHQKSVVEVAFDANPDEQLLGTISYIATDATETNGAAYYEAKIELLRKPEWIRPGLNADVYVTTKEKKDALRIPSRFLITEKDGATYALIRNDLTLLKTPVTVGLRGNDGYVEILDLEEGTEVTLP